LIASDLDDDNTISQTATSNDAKIESINTNLLNPIKKVIERFETFLDFYSVCYNSIQNMKNELEVLKVMIFQLFIFLYKAIFDKYSEDLLSPQKDYPDGRKSTRNQIYLTIKGVADAEDLIMKAKGKLDLDEERVESDDAHNPLKSLAQEALQIFEDFAGTYNYLEGLDRQELLGIKKV
jgi:hypothetical protein